MTGKIILAVCTLFLAVGPAHAQLSLTDKAIIRKTGRLQLDIHYPQAGNPGIDRLLDQRSKASMSPAELQFATAERPYSVTISYKVKRNDAQFLSIQFISYVFTGGAHGLPDAQSYNFLMPGGAQVFLPELVDGQRGLDLISKLAIAELVKQLGTAHLDWIQSGAAPHAWNFANFAWLPDALELTFTPYQVAAYVDGFRTVRIPLPELASVIRPEPRAPAPSFPCSSAKTAIEKSVCSDATLARLDRQVAEQYAMQLVAVPTAKADEKTAQRDYRLAQQSKHDAQLAAQRAWLAQRDRDCAGGSKTCLFASYQARQAVLLKSPS
jgi:uncharacterized protein YecT (DUF1311 family)